MKIEPLSDRILIEPLEAEEIKGLIIIPDVAKVKPQQGKVIETGPGKLDGDGKIIPMQVKKGDKILYGKYSGAEITVDGEEYLIMWESDILAVLK